MKKLLKLLICFAMACSLFSNLPYRVSADEAEGNVQQEEGKDYSDTTQQRDVKSIEFSATAAGEDLSKFHTAPIYDVKSNKLILPRIEGYTVEIFGSDRKEIIDVDGNVVRGLETLSVNLLYKITSKADKTVIKTGVNAVIKIPGRELSFVGDNEKPVVMPALREWAAGTGKITLTQQSRIVVGSDKFAQTATIFKKDLAEISGLDLTIVNGDGSALLPGDIFLAYEENEIALGKEGYYIEFGGSDASADYTVVRANQTTGALYGTISILQILKSVEGHTTLPKGITRDYPMYERRGMHLDVARKFIPMEYLQDLSKQMSWFKLNTLALHINDCDIWETLSTTRETEGYFRLESEKFPEIVAKDHYTKEEFRQLQYDDMNLGINIIPEIDSPGHAMAFTKAWPDLMLGSNKKYLDVTKPATLQRMKDLFDEYIIGYEGGEPTFVGPDVNVGTDEYKAAGSLKEAFRAYADALLKHVNSTGKQAVFWGSLSENAGTTPVTTDAIMFAWYKGYANAKESLDAGYKIISMEDQEVYIVPGGGYYSNQFGRANYLYDSWLPNDNQGWNGNPAPLGHPNMIGGQFAVWNDFIGNGISVQDISYRIQHNLYTIAEKCWAGSESKQAGRSYNNLKTQAAKLGDAPNADFLYNIEKPIKDNEVIKLDAAVQNETAPDTGAAFVKHENLNEQVAGKNGNGLQFNGGKSYIETDIKSTGFDWTFALWMNPDADNAANSVLMEGKTGTLKLNGGHLEYSVEQYTHTFNETIPSGKWTHVALVGNFEGVALYVNGKHIDTLKGKIFPNYNCNSGNNSWNGNEPNNGTCKTASYYETLMLPTQVIGGKTNAFKGKVDELIVYNKQLTSKEIEKLAGAEATKDYENVAAGKKVVSTNPVNSTNVAANAVDGKLSPTWEFALNEKGPYVIDIPLKAGEDVNHVVMKQRLWGSEISRIKTMKIEAVTGDVSTTLYEGASDGVVFSDSGLRYATKDITFETATADNVRLTITPKGIDGDSMVNIAEIELYGTKEKTQEVKKNLAKGKAVTSSGEETADFPATKAVDGNISTRWSSNTNATSTEANHNGWLSVDLGEVKAIDHVVINWEAAYATEYKILVSKTGTNPTDFKEVAHITDGKQEIRTIHFDKQDARYVKFQGIKKRIDDVWILGYSIYEFEVYGDEIEGTDPEEGAAIPHKSMSVFADDENAVAGGGTEGPASYAIDDNPGTWWHTNYQAFTPLPHSITLDLKQAKVINKYDYLPRPGAANGTISSYDIQVSLDNVHYFSVKKGTWEGTAAKKTVEFEPITARYVRLVALEGKAGFASAAELNVYGSTKTGIETFYLAKLIEQADKLDEESYFSATYAPVVAEIVKAKVVLAAAISQNAVNAAYDDLSTKMKALVKRGDKSELDALYQEYKELKEEDYTQGSFQEFKKTLDKVKALLEGTSDITQKEINKVKESLLLAHSSLADIGSLSTALNAAKAKAEYDYSNATMETLMDAIKNGEKVLKDAEASLYDVKTAENKLLDAISDLKFNKDKLQAAMQAYETAVEIEYTTSTWAIYKEKYAAAVVLNTQSAATIEACTQARKDLDKAREALQKRGDTKDLVDFMEANKNLIEKDYTADSWALYADKVNNAKAVIEDNRNASAADIANILTALNAAKEGLVKVDSEDTTLAKSILKSAIDKATIAEASKDFETLAPSVKALIISMHKEAQSVYDNVAATNAQCMQAWINLANALQFLDFQADKDALLTLIKTCNDINTDEFNEGVEEFKEALIHAQSIYDNPNALQASINDAWERLDNAKNGLKKNEVSVDKSFLEAVISSLEKQVGDGSKYKQDSNWTAFAKALADAKVVLANATATQAEVNAALNTLTSTYENIRLLPSEEQLAELNGFLAAMSGINRSRFSNAQLKVIDETTEKVKSMINDFDEKQFPSLQKEMADTLGIINEVNTDASIKPVDSDKKGSTNAAQPNTGDNTRVATMIFALLLSGCGVAIIRRLRNKKLS